MTIELLAPAKINLGLEVVRKRDDGYHDIVTVFQTVSVFDRLRIDPSAQDSVELLDPNAQIESNLAERALQMAGNAGFTTTSHRIALEKRIPVAAGMGGASADAAAVLRAIAPDEATSLHEQALRLGSDVPFLLTGGAALARGRGDLLETLPSLENCWFVLVCPSVELERKTARLYGALQPGDFSDGARINRVAASLRNQTIPDPADLANAFSRALASLIPEIPAMIDEFARAGAPFVALSGAGPAHYTIVPSLQHAICLASELARSHAQPWRILIARPVRSGLQVRRNKTEPPATAL